MTEIRLAEKSYVRKASLLEADGSGSKALRIADFLVRHCRTMWLVVSLCDNTFILLFYRFSAVGLILELTSSVGSVGVGRADRYTGPQRGQQRVFLPLPLPYPCWGHNNRTPGHTARDRGVPALTRCVAARERGCRGQRHLPSRRTALSRTLCLPPTEQWD